MDNVTHSLAGMLVADAVCVFRGEQRKEVRAAAWLVSACANNLPDLDISYSWMDGPPPLGSLLNHRGHSHTLLVALPLAWLFGVGAWRWFSRRHASAGASERRLLLALALAGPVLHLLLDFGNNYGVHPFWPFYSGWLYGDSIYIVEPLWLAILIPTLTPRLTRRWLAWLLWLVLAGLLVVAWFVPFVTAGSRASLFGGTLLAWLVARRGSERFRVVFAALGCAAVALTFALGSARAKSELEQATLSAFPALQVHDLATTPLPANPRCWEGFVAGEQGGQYRVVRATIALAPLSARDCRAGADVEPSAPVTPIERAGRGGVRFISEYRAEVSELSRLRRDDCRFRALLHFARLPYVGAGKKLAGDLRYDRKPGRDFADVELAGPTEECPRFVPGWTEPRAELFQP